MIDAPIRPAEQYRAFLEQGRFMLQRARGSGAYIFYPRVAEPRTGATDLDWVEASGRGIVYSVTVQRNRPPVPDASLRSEQHTSELQSLMRTPYAASCLNK